MRDKPQPVATFPRTPAGEEAAWRFVKSESHGTILPRTVSLTWERERIDAYARP